MEEHEDRKRVEGIHRGHLKAIPFEEIMKRGYAVDSPTRHELRGAKQSRLNH
jgi:hypothetical protein